MDVIELLTEDHREVDELFRRFHLADRPDTKHELASQIIRELSVHAAVEEQFLYPLVRLQLAGTDADHAIDEHAEVKELLSDLEQQEAGSPKHDATMEEVIESVRHHVDEEETGIFPRLRDETDAAVLDRLADVVAQAKKVVPTHPHPLVPGTATAQLVAGPWAAIIDRTRDLLSTSS